MLPEFVYGLALFFGRHLREILVGLACALAHLSKVTVIIAEVDKGKAQLHAGDGFAAPEVGRRLFEDALGERVGVGGEVGVRLVYGKIFDIKVHRAEVEAERVDRRCANDAFDAGCGRRLIYVKGAGAVNVKKPFRRAAPWKGNSGQVDDAFAAFGVCAQRFVIVYIAPCVGRSLQFEGFVEANDVHLVALRE